MLQNHGPGIGRLFDPRSRPTAKQSKLSQGPCTKEIVLDIRTCAVLTGRLRESCLQSTDNSITAMSLCYAVREKVCSIARPGNEYRAMHGAPGGTIVLD